MFNLVKGTNLKVKILKKMKAKKEDKNVLISFFEFPFYKVFLLILKSTSLVKMITEALIFHHLFPN